MANVNVSVEYPIAKLDNELQLVTGIVLEPDEIDAQDDTISADEIREAAHNFLRSFNEQTELGLGHKMFGTIGLELAESWIAPFDFELEGEKVKAGSWIMTVKVLDLDIWAAIKAGELTGFSIGGTATVTTES